MLDIERALKQDRLLRALTGMNRKAFDALLPTFSKIYEQTCVQEPRQRAIGGGRKARLRHIQDKRVLQAFGENKMLLKSSKNNSNRVDENRAFYLQRIKY